MNEMMTYIFDSMKKSEKRLNVVARTLAAQKKLNRSFAGMSYVMAIAIVVDTIAIKDMKRTIYKLENEIKEMKSSEGEYEM